MKIVFGIRLFVCAIIGMILVWYFVLPIYILLAISSILYSIKLNEDLSRMSMHIFNKWIHKFGLFCEKIFDFLLIKKYFNI